MEPGAGSRDVSHCGKDVRRSDVRHQTMIWFCATWCFILLQERIEISELRIEVAAPPHSKIVAKLCMAFTVASRHCVPKAPVRLHKATPELLTANCSLLIANFWHLMSWHP